MKADQNKEILYIAYNHANMPTTVSMRRGEIYFIYDALGNKWYKFSKDEKAEEAKGTAYIFGMQYEFKENNNIKYDWKLMFIGTDEGYVSAVYPGGIDSEFKFQYVYNHTDHLGNIRQNITKENGQLTVLREHNYYPFGLLHRGYNEEKEDLKYDKEQDFIFTVQAQAGRYKYKFQGQERQEDLDLGWDSFKYRNYDYAIGRFFNVDPLAAKYPYNSTYAFQENKLGLGRELEGLELAYLNSTYISQGNVYQIERNSNSITVTRHPHVYGPLLESDYQNVHLRLGSNVRQQHITDYSSIVIADNMIASHNQTATITSGYRNARNQARVMYHNIVKYGVASQKKLYKKYGDMVIDVYVKAKAYNSMAQFVNNSLGINLLQPISKNGIIKLMTNKINEIGPGKVSKHSSDPKKYNVIDLSPRSIENLSGLIKSFMKDKRIKKVIRPGNDPGLHIEIPQKQK